MEYKYFKQNEVYNLQHYFVTCLDVARERANVPFIITSGWRSAQKNMEVEGVSNSKHIKGEAVDLRILSGTETARMIEALLSIPYFEVVIEKDHIHVEWNSETFISKLFIRNA